MKKIILSFALLLIVGITAAFTLESKPVPSTDKALVQEWFIFIGNPGEESDNTRYQLVAQDPDCPDMGTKRCAVLATRVTGSNPAIPNLNLSYSSFNKP